MAKINYDDNISITSILDKLPNENVANNLREEYDSLTVLIGNMLKSLKDNPTTAVKTRTETLKMYTAMRDACLNNILRYLATNSGSQAVVQSIMHDYQVKLQGHYSNTAIGIAAIGREASLTEAQQAQLSKLLIDFGDVSTKLLTLTVSKLWAELG
jgi:hypothetical protein